jgi:hypothetical protein
MTLEWERVGAAAFIGLALVYGATAPRWDWILVISGPLAAVGLLYLLSWRLGSADRRTAQKDRRLTVSQNRVF